MGWISFSLATMSCFNCTKFAPKSWFFWMCSVYTHSYHVCKHNMYLNIYVQTYLTYIRIYIPKVYFIYYIYIWYIACWYKVYLQSQEWILVNKSPSQHLHGRRCKWKMLNPSWERLEGLQWTCFHQKPDNASATCWFISGSSWELRYPFPKHFWKWFSFFEKWDMLYSFLEGTPSENILELGNCTNNCWTWFARQTTRSQPQKPLLDKTYISVCHFATAAFWVPETRKFVWKKKLNLPQLPWTHTTHIYQLPFWKCQRNQSFSTASAACRSASLLSPTAPRFQPPRPRWFRVFWDGKKNGGRQTSMEMMVRSYKSMPYPKCWKKFMTLWDDNPVGGWTNPSEKY